MISKNLDDNSCLISFGNNYIVHNDDTIFLEAKSYKKIRNFGLEMMQNKLNVGDRSY